MYIINRVLKLCPFIRPGSLLILQNRAHATATATVIGMRCHYVGLGVAFCEHTLARNCFYKNPLISQKVMKMLLRLCLEAKGQQMYMYIRGNTCLTWGSCESPLKRWMAFVSNRHALTWCSKKSAYRYTYILNWTHQVHARASTYLPHVVLWEKQWPEMYAQCPYNDHPNTQTYGAVNLQNNGRNKHPTITIISVVRELISPRDRQEDEYRFILCCFRCYGWGRCKLHVGNVVHVHKCTCSLRKSRLKMQKYAAYYAADTLAL